MRLLVSIILAVTGFAYTVIVGPHTTMESNSKKITIDTLLVSAKNPIFLGAQRLSIPPHTLILERKNYDAFLILADGLSSITTMDKTGTPLDTLKLIQEASTNNGHRQVKIFSDSLIVFTDSLFSWRTNTFGLEIKESEKLEIQTHKFKISINGQFEKLSQIFNTAPSTAIDPLCSSK